MNRLVANVVTLLMMLMGGTRVGAAGPVAGSEGSPFLLGPPKQTGPVVVHASFEFQDIHEIDDGAETFEFAGVLTLEWHDPRQAFDPAALGVDEKVFQGTYQVDELSTGWYPQVFLVNASGLYQKNGVVLRVRPDGTSTLIETLNASAEVELDLRRFPYDSQRLEAVFEVLGFGPDEVQLQVKSDAGSSAGGASPGGAIQVPQWEVTGVHGVVSDRSASYAGPRGIASALVVSVDVRRESWFARRLVVIPLIVIVLLSFSVFWMDRSSLGDRLSVSFIGVLTTVAYNIVTSDQLPRISYVTLMHGFLNLSFLTVSATVVINLVVGALDKSGRSELGDRIDRRSRWAFPLAYFGLIFAMVGVAFLLL